MLSKIVVVCYLSLPSIFAGVLTNQDVRECQRNYDEKIGELVASAGMSAADVVMRMLFDSLDLNKDLRISGSELVLKLNVSAVDMNSLFDQAQAWITSADPQNGELELTFNKFKDAVRDTIGRVDNYRNSDDRWHDILPAICSYFTHHLPKILSSLQDLNNCITTLNKEQFQTAEQESDRMVVNTWKAAFSTLDRDSDLMVSLQEIADTLLSYNDGLNASLRDLFVVDLSSFLKEENLNESRFLSAIVSLLLSQDDQVWMNITSESELEGKSLFCEALRETRNDVIERLQENVDCISLYNETLTKVLHDDASVAPGYIFTLADKNRDGFIKSTVLKELIFAFRSQQLLVDVRYNSSYKLETFTKILPDHVEVVKESANDDSFELSILSSSHHEMWKSFCMASTEALEAFPTSMLDRVGSNGDPDVSCSNASAANLSDDDLIAELRQRLPGIETQEKLSLLLTDLLSLVDPLPAPTGTELVFNLGTIKAEVSADNFTIQSNNSEAVTSLIPTMSSLEQELFQYLNNVSEFNEIPSSFNDNGDSSKISKKLQLQHSMTNAIKDLE